MDREEIFEFLQAHVTHGSITTYRELSLLSYGHTQGARAIGSMLRALAAHDPSRSTWTNRVIASNGNTSVPGQFAQLIDEGVAVRNGRVWIDQANLVHHQVPASV